jgi:CheY-like chemotaxis protein
MSAFDVLMVDDSVVDAMMVSEALISMQDVDLHVVHSGAEALAYLHGEGAHFGAPRPRLILLDVGMPRMNGHETLARIRAEHEFDDIPVIMFSSSVLREDRDKAAARLATAYLAKPGSFDELANAVRPLVSLYAMDLPGESTARPAV